MKCSKCKETECKHSNVIYCESCQRIECVGCGKTWGENQATFIPYYNPPVIYPTWPDYQWSYTTEIIDSRCETNSLQ